MAAALKKTDEPVNVNRLPRRLLNAQLRAEAEGYLHTVWSADIQRPNEIADILARDFWSIVANQMKRGDIVHVRDVPGYSTFVQLYVVGADRLGADVIELARHATPAPAPEAPAE